MKLSDDFLVGIHINDMIWILGSLMSSRFVIKFNCSIRFFLMMIWPLFIIDLLGLFTRLHNLHSGFAHYRIIMLYYLMLFQ